MSGDILAYKTANIEQKLNDAESRSEHLARISGTPPMNWYEFQKTQKVNVPPSWNSIGTLLGAGAGLLIFMAGGALAVSLVRVLSGPVGSGLLALGFPGMLVAAGVGAMIGRQHPAALDKRQAQVDAYQNYLDEFEKSRSPGQERQLSASEEVAPPSFAKRDAVIRSRDTSPSFQR